MWNLCSIGVWKIFYPELKNSRGTLHACVPGKNLPGTHPYKTPHKAYLCRTISPRFLCLEGFATLPLDVFLLKFVQNTYESLSSFPIHFRLFIALDFMEAGKWISVLINHFVILNLAVLFSFFTKVCISDFQWIDLSMIYYCAEVFCSNKLSRNHFHFSQEFYIYSQYILHSWDSKGGTPSCCTDIYIEKTRFFHTFLANTDFNLHLFFRGEIPVPDQTMQIM